MTHAQRHWSKTLAAVLGALLLGSCSKTTFKQPSTEVVVLEAQFARDGEDYGAIKGDLSCDGPPVPDDLFCGKSNLSMARAALTCGAKEVTIYQGWIHSDIVYFPARMHDKFEAIPTDLEIVRCIKKQLGFSFWAGIAKSGDPTTILETNGHPFLSLHSNVSEK